MYVDVQIHSYQVEDEHVRVIHTYSNQSYSKGKKIILQSITPVTVFGEIFWHCCKNSNPSRKKLMLQGLIKQCLVLVKKLCPRHILLPHWCHWPYICLRRVLESIKQYTHVLSKTYSTNFIHVQRKVRFLFVQSIFPFP